MLSSELRDKFIRFFEKKGHIEIKPAPLVLENDTTTLFTSAGMQPLVRYLKGEPHPAGNRLVNAQPCFRSQDIEEVGDSRHTTFFEMLGNWSLGDYFKKEQLENLWNFLIVELDLPVEKLYVTVFEGETGVPKDEETYQIWKDLGVAEDHIYFYPAKKNWWSLTGDPKKMVPGDVGGPDSEVFYEFDLPHDPLFGEKCHPNCDCGRFLEIGNSVFIQYLKNEDGTLTELPQKNVDFGGGLERLVAATNNTSDIYDTDLYKPIIGVLCKVTGLAYDDQNKSDMRIIADHMKSATFLINSGVIPSNKLHGYILRRLLRRSAVKLYQLTKDMKFLGELANIYIAIKTIYQGLYGVTLNEDSKEKTLNIINDEMNKFGKTLSAGYRLIDKIENIDGKIAFNLYQTHGFPLEVTEELVKLKGFDINKEEFYTEFEKHKELSRSASIGMFKGGLAGTGKMESKYHTATHLLHAALRKILGDQVLQRGSNITAERLRFDFSYSEKVSTEKLKAVEDMVNEQIKKGTDVVQQEMSKKDAEKMGAIGFFGQKYGDIVSVYTIGDFSKEFCGGPHVKKTSEIEHVTITREESAGAGIRRIYAVIRN